MNKDVKTIGIEDVRIFLGVLGFILFIGCILLAGHLKSLGL